MSGLGGARKKTTKRKTQQQPTGLFNAVLPSTEMCPSGDQREGLELNIASQYIPFSDANYASGVAYPSEQLSPLDDFGSLTLGDSCIDFPSDGDLLNLDDSYLDILKSPDNRQDENSLAYDGGNLNAFSSDYSSGFRQSSEYCQGTLPTDNFSGNFSVNQSYLPYQSDDHYYPSSILQVSDNTGPSDSFGLPAGAQYHGGACGVGTSTSTLQLPPETDYSNIAPRQPSSSRKGYKHRHERAYGLSEEDQKKRNQEFNNEASQLYRARKSLRLKDLESEGKLQEAKQRKLQRQQQMLLILKQKLQEQLNQ
ncbi:hypothetical protein SK128_009692 [Halocaridina rubra]|uniref:BZIP domain-containing protein n=1 Tax=Halocaridina rubra TaxID=373956 RepID=A0AAN8X1W6_HALRR